jgi:hypothetical protein
LPGYISAPLREADLQAGKVHPCDIYPFFLKLIAIADTPGKPIGLVPPEVMSLRLSAGYAVAVRSAQIPFQDLHRSTVLHELHDQDLTLLVQEVVPLLGGSQAFLDA